MGNHQEPIPKAAHSLFEKIMAKPIIQAGRAKASPLIHTLAIIKYNGEQCGTRLKNSPR
jgi:hypothetical protein